MTGASRLRRGFAVVVAVCALLVAAACADDGSDDSTGSAANDTGTAAGAQATEATTPLPSEGEPTPVATGGAETVSIEACDLVTAEEAAAALGEPVVAGQPALVGEIQTCSYMPERGGSIGSVQVAYVTRSVAPSEFPAVISEAVAADLEPLEGIGDTAFWDGDQVIALIGDVAISTIAIPPSDATTSAADRDASTELARLAAERVP